MWKRCAEHYACPVCRGHLSLVIFQEREVEVGQEFLARAEQLGILDKSFRSYVESGLFACANCRLAFPIFEGLPIFLLYPTELHKEFSAEFKDDMEATNLGYSFPNASPAAGEEFVMKSFSKEWLSYDYDGVIWELSYDDHEKRFLAEIGPEFCQTTRQNFLEVGCGIGNTTNFAQKAFQADAFGVDLSLAALKSAKHYIENPFMHFAQASVFHLPFRESSFDVIYSRGVLHHTYSTKTAFDSVSKLSRQNGMVYIWVYGPSSINDNLFRRILFLSESLLRPLLSRSSDSFLSSLVLNPIALAYMLFNALRRLGDPTIQPLTLRRALHAARDRYTPKFAHRHCAVEVVKWFEGVGFDKIQVVDWKSMPSADHDDYRRNVGVRALHP